MVIKPLILQVLQVLKDIKSHLNRVFNNIKGI